MKLLIIGFLLMTIGGFLLYSVNFNESDHKNISERIIIKETLVQDGIKYQIIQIDGQEYISQSNGGICPILKLK